jgi:hypothetical protein
MKTNWYLRAGLLLVGVLLGVNHFFELPHLVYGLGLGLGIALELIGLYAINHDLKKIRECKKRIFGAAGKKACRTQ